MSRIVSPSFASELFDLLPHRDPHLWIQPGGRLIQEQDLAAGGDEPKRDIQPPLHAAGVASSQNGRLRR